MDVHLTQELWSARSAESLAHESANHSAPPDVAALSPEAQLADTWGGQYRVTAE